MHHFVRRTLTALFVAIGLGLVPNAASAAIASGYVCSVSLDPRAGTFGSSGFIDFTITSSPDCTGTNGGNFRVLSTGADASWHGFRYSSTQLLEMFDQLHRAAVEGNKVTFGYTGGASGVGAQQITIRR